MGHGIWGIGVSKVGAPGVEVRIKPKVKAQVERSYILVCLGGGPSLFLFSWYYHELLCFTLQSVLVWPLNYTVILGRSQTGNDLCTLGPKICGLGGNSHVGAAAIKLGQLVPRHGKKASTGSVHYES